MRTIEDDLAWARIKLTEFLRIRGFSPTVQLATWADSKVQFWLDRVAVHTEAIARRDAAASAEKGAVA